MAALRFLFAGWALAFLYCWPAPLRAPQAPAAPKITVSGYVQDAASGEKLIGATVYAPEREVGTATNRYGFYSLTLPAGPVRFAYSYVGFEDHLEDLTLHRDTTLIVELEPATAELEGLVVEGRRKLTGYALFPVIPSLSYRFSF